MKKIKLTLLLLFFICASCFGNHIKGGFFTYKYLGAGIANPANNRYEIVLNVYMECSPPPSSGQLSPVINFSIFDGGSNILIRNESVNISSQYVISKGADEPCITGNQMICYYTIVEYKLASIELPPLPKGYIISYQRCCRINGIVNIDNSASIGNTYSIAIPGTDVGQGADKNNSAIFQINDTIVVCGDNYFEYSFLAEDPDTNTLRYSFCDAWAGGGPGQGQATPATASNPPYDNNIVPYSSGFSGSSPLGPNVKIDPVTGLISGTAPTTIGEYVITVCVNEYKNGVLIASTRKELHIKVGDCSPIRAVLRPVYPTCDGFTRTFANEIPPDPAITSYFWDFGDNSTSSAATPTHTYLDTGVYTIKLVINRGGSCSDSTTALVKVFPGFFPGFNIRGLCINKSTLFFDSTTTVYGVVDSWSWNFGDAATLADTSHLKNPQYTYTQTGIKNVSLIVTNSKGCIDTVFRAIDIFDKPPLSVGFKDTLICRGDALQLQAIGSGSFTWTPTTDIIAENSDAPTVSPLTTRTYRVELNDNGCTNQDSVRVRVADFITLQTGPPLTICLTDSVQLSATSNALRFQWAPATELNNATLINPRARPSLAGINRYTLTAFLGGCIPATADFVVTAVPYPTAIINTADDTICFRGATILNATITGNTFTWSPLTGLTNATSLTPVAAPQITTRYILTVTDPASGCPKPSSDTLLVTVLPKIFPFAGRDTVVVINEPLQFGASGGIRYSWSPGTDLSSTTLSNPVGKYRGNYDSIRYRVNVFNEYNCVDSAFITVKIFKTVPQVFVPTGFTPNSDGKNDLVLPVAVGIKKIEYFRIFNRWGEMVFNTTTNGHGWDGKINGKDQGTNVFVWVVKAIDYIGKEFFAKGTVTLIR